jgi:hypothetical protein
MNAKSFFTFLIAGVFFISLPVVVFFIFRFFMARMITTDNAGIVFDEFQGVLDKGAIIRDPLMAADVAGQAYREKMKQTALDGWGRPFRIHSSVRGSRCELKIESAGPDGAFGTGDDVSLERTFDLPAAKVAGSTRPS